MLVGLSGPEAGRVSDGAWTEVFPDRVALLEGFMGPGETGQLLEALRALPTWSQERLPVRGVEGGVPFHRLVAWHGDPGVGYRYSGIEHPAAGWTPELLAVRDRIEALLGVRPNGVLLNRYRDGRDSIGRHSDREDDLVPGSPIVGVSLGAARTMRIRPAGGRASDGTSVPLRDGSLLLMHGDCQRALTHEVRKDPAVTGERISLTFRSVRT